MIQESALDSLQEEEEKERLIYTGFNDGTSIFSKKKEASQGREIWCKASDKCELYQKGQCVCRNHNLLSFSRCKFGHVVLHRGPTRNAKSFSKFRATFTENEMYDKLKGPVNQRLFVVKDYVGLCLPYICFDEKTKRISDPMLFSSTDVIFLKLEEFTNEFILRVCTFRPQAMMGGTIKSYEEEVVPDFLSQMKLYVPEIYNGFIKEHPEYTVTEINYVGKKAYLKTLKKGCTVQGFVFDGEYMTNPHYRIPFFFVAGAATEVRFKVEDDMVVQITDNSQVDENTQLV